MSTQTHVQNTEEIVASMLRENTGRHMLDSGGAYGRNWEHNQGRDFANEPAIVTNWRHGWIDITLQTYSFLVEALEYEPELDAKFEAWCHEGEREHEPWLPLMEEFIEQAKETPEDEPFASFTREADANPLTGEYWDGDTIWTVNTYNHESLLEQVLQYTMFGSLVFLQVHGGCDVRGGYTQPRVFRFYDESPSLLDDARATLRCDGCADQPWGTFWETDDGFRWDFGDGSIGARLEDYPAADISEPEGFAAWVARGIVLDVLAEHGEDTDLLPIRAYHHEENYSLCPICRTGTLHAC